MNCENCVASLNGVCRIKINPYILHKNNKYGCSYSSKIIQNKLNNYIVTNRDKYFHNTTDEELAALLVRGCMYVMHDDENRCIKYDCRCTQCWLDWLKQEARE